MIAGRSGIGFPHRDVADSQSLVLEFPLEFGAQIARQIFGGGIGFGEGLNVVEELVIEAFR